MGTLAAAADALSAGRNTQAVLLLEAFFRHLDALTPGKISEASGDDLRELAGEILELLEIAGGRAGPQLRVLRSRDGLGL